MDIKGRLLKGPGYKRMCDFEGPGHNRIVEPNRPVYQITQGDAQGFYHGPRCYQAALQKYNALKKELNINQPEHD